MIDKEKIININDNNKYIIRKKFVSKRNEVYLVDLKRGTRKTFPCVLKKYIIDKDNKSKEAFLLKILLENGINVPKIYSEGSNYLLLEYIEGKTLLEELSNLEDEQGLHIDHKKNYRILYDLFKWLQSFYNVTDKILSKGYIFGDMNFRNFIVKDRIYGIDLENCNCNGYRETDGGKFCAYLLTYKPAFTEWKIELATLAIEVMTKKFNYNYDMLKGAFEKELKEIEKRRSMKVNFHEIRQIFHI